MKDLEHPESEVEEARQALHAVFSEVLEGATMRELEQILEEAEDLPTLILTASEFSNREDTGVDVLQVLRSQGMFEEEVDQGILETGPTASDAPPEESTAEKVRRAEILLTYDFLFSPERRRQLLETEFIAEGSLELNIYRAAVWTLVEADLDRVHGDRVQAEAERAPDKKVSQKRAKQIKNEVEAELIEHAKAVLRARDIEEPLA